MLTLLLSLKLIRYHFAGEEVGVEEGVLCDLVHSESKEKMKN